MKNRKLRVLMLGPGLNVRGGVSTVERLILQYVAPEVSIKHLSTMENGSALYKIGVFLRCLVQVFFRLIGGRVDIVHVHFAVRGSVVRKMTLAWMARLFRKPLILHAHGADFDVFYNDQPGWFKRLIRSFVQHCDRFIALSDSWLDYYVNTTGVPAERALVLLNPVVCPSELPARNGRSTVTFIYLGIMDKRKGAFDLVQAFSHLHQSGAQVRLMMAGDGEVDAVRNQIKALGLEESSMVFNWITPEQRDRLLEESDVFVLPSHHEGLPMAMLEAMSWGLPVISTPVGGIPEVIVEGQNGLLIPSGNVDLLTQAMRRITDDETLRQTMGRNARQTVEPLDIRAYCKELTALYQSIRR